ncbi:MAG: hypothetical protein PHI97_12205 [Desulfobulbus sp.]|nr:hypothetical protein [Desulfobulbus sp.]
MLSIAANQLGLKQKSLFDQLVEDREVLEKLAQMADQYQTMDSQRQQKTYVVSRSALLSLEYVAKTCGLPRDLLVELSIQRLVPILSFEREKQQKRRLIFSNLEQLCQHADQLRWETVKALGQDDLATQLVAALQSHCQRTVDELLELIEQGKALDRYQ